MTVAAMPATNWPSKWNVSKRKHVARYDGGNALKQEESRRKRTEFEQFGQRKPMNKRDGKKFVRKKKTFCLLRTIWHSDRLLHTIDEEQE